MRLAVPITFRRTASADSTTEKDLNGRCMAETDPITRVAVLMRMDDVSGPKPIE